MARPWAENAVVGPDADAQPAPNLRQRDLLLRAEEELAGLLADRGILYQECWVHNIGGVMAGAEMYTKGAAADRKKLLDRIARVCADITRRNLTEAREKGLTPTENAYRSVEARIYG